MIVNGIFLIVDMVAAESEGIHNSTSAIIASVAIGISLLRSNSTKGLAFARFAIGFGAIVFTAINLFSKDYVSATIQLLFSLSLMGLIFGTPGILRTRISVSVIICYFLLQLAGTQAYLTGYNPIARLLCPGLQKLEKMDSL